jgi:hypothetical protein
LEYAARHLLATVIPGFSYTADQNVAGATTAASDPSLPCAAGQRYKSVWYRIDPGGDIGRLRVDTIGSGYDTVLAVWEANGGTLINRACNDDSGGGGTSALSVPVFADRTYYIEVAAFADSAGALHLNTDLDPGWIAEFWNSETPGGSPAATRYEPNLNFEWLNGAPDPAINPDHFSSRWTRRLDLDDDGGGGRASQIAWTADSTGWIYIQVRSFNDVAGPGHFYDLQRQ